MLPWQSYITSRGMWVIIRVLLGSWLWKTHIQIISHIHHCTFFLKKKSFTNSEITLPVTLYRTELWPCVIYWNSVQISRPVPLWTLSRRVHWSCHPKHISAPWQKNMCGPPWSSMCICRRCWRRHKLQGSQRDATLGIRNPSLEFPVTHHLCGFRKDINRTVLEATQKKAVPPVVLEDYPEEEEVNSGIFGEG